MSKLLSGTVVGDTVLRWLGGMAEPMRLRVTAVTEHRIICGPWEFDRATGAEIDDLLGWGPAAATGSIIRVSADPAGRENEDATPAHQMSANSTAHSNPAGAPNMDPRFAAAIARGDVVRQQLTVDEGGSISSTEAAHLLGVAKATVLRRWRAHRMVGWKQAKEVRFPVWQFAGAKLLPGIEEILQIFHSDDQWRVMMYFLGNRLSLEGRRPLDLLREGKVPKVVAHAKAYASDDNW
jgi:hypothetical protein